MKIFRYLLLFVIAFVSHYFTYSQKIELGSELGFGNAVFSPRKQYISSYSQPSYKYNRIGIVCFISPVKGPFSFKTGILYNRFNWIDHNLNFAQIILGPEFKFGRKIAGILGGGLSFSYLFLYKNFNYNADFASSRKRFQYGWYINTGIGYHISERVFIDLKCQYGFDFSPIDQTKIHNTHSGSFEKIDERIWYAILCTSVRYLIIKNTNKK